jgi:hypothetical protein
MNLPVHVFFHGKFFELLSSLITMGDEAVEVGLDISTAMSKASWLIAMHPAKGKQGSTRLPCKKNRAC